MQPVFFKALSITRVAGGALGIIGSLLQFATNGFYSIIAVLFSDEGIIPTGKIGFAFLLTIGMFVAAISALTKPTLGGLAMVGIGTYCIAEPYLFWTPRGNPAVISVVAGAISLVSGLAMDYARGPRGGNRA